MKQTYAKLFSGVTLAVLLTLSSCQSPYKLTKIEGSMIIIDSVWDAQPDADALALLAPYKAAVDSMMYRVVGSERNDDESRCAREFIVQFGGGCPAGSCCTNPWQASRYGIGKYGRATKHTLRR